MSLPTVGTDGNPRHTYEILENLANGNTEEKLCQVHNRLRLLRMKLKKALRAGIAGVLG